jgi:hypothetical protein
MGSWSSPAKAGKIHTPLLIEFNPFLFQKVALHSATVAKSMWADLSLEIDHPLPGYICLSWEGGHGITYHPGCHSADKPGYLTICDHMSGRHLAHNVVDPFIGFCGLRRFHNPHDMRNFNLRQGFIDLSFESRITAIEVTRHSWRHYWLIIRNLMIYLKLTIK